MASSKINCAQCNKQVKKENTHINRAKKRGTKLFCSMLCCSESKRRKNYKAKEIISHSEMVANNYLSGSKIWATSGVMMNLELPSMIYRGNV